MATFTPVNYYLSLPLDEMVEYAELLSESDNESGQKFL
nr:MAG TPA: hypothetical protein [Caudoviricetes sp.]